MKFSYRATLQYWGANYFGWQKQPDLPTIQSELEKALKHICKSELIRTKASGRTDAGVHALGQVVRMDLPVSIPPNNLMRACNQLLPDDIKLISSEVCVSEFCPQRMAKSKEYHYRFFLKPEKDVTPSHDIFQDLYIYQLRDVVDLELMQKACDLFCGKYEFSHFYCEGTPVKSYVREIYSCSIEQVTAHEGFAPYYYLKISGNGFLKQMVRLIMGAIWSVGASKLDLEILKCTLENPSKVAKRHLAPLAPAKGLLLHHVVY